MKHLAIIAVVLLLFASCKPARVITRYEKSEIETTSRDIIVTLRAPALHLTDKPAINIITDPDNGNQVQVEPSVLETDFCRSVLRMENNRLIHDLFQKDAQLDSLIRGAEKTTTQTITVKEPYEVRYLTWWDKLWKTLGKIFSAALFILFLWWRITK